MINKLFLDLNNFKANIGSIERGDSVELSVKLLDNQEYSNSSFRLLGGKSDGKVVEQIEGINLEGQTLKILLETQFVNCEGIVKMELNVVSENTEATTKEFYFFVSNTMNGEIIDSTDSIPTLEKVSKYVDDAVENLDTFKEAAKDITVINTEFKDNELKRKANELLREKSEKARLINETRRTTTEEDRETNELERIKNENDRKVSESNRKLAENNRKTSERAREEAELNRQEIFEENESLRNLNENSRIEEEKKRKSFYEKSKNEELKRNEEETIRINSESSRVLAENNRVNAETLRERAEANRENTYNNFNDAEVERKANENKRVAAETERANAELERVNAEITRDDRYTKAEEKRETIFSQKEKDRENTFNASEITRSDKFKENEIVRDNAFKLSEQTREDAEVLRIENEKTRVNSESTRETSELERVEAEKLRVAAEEERKQTLINVEADVKRIDGALKEHIDNHPTGGSGETSTEVIEARTGFFGKEHTSLKERLDEEFSFQNKSQKGDFIEQVESNSHFIQNTIEGQTRDMVIKGTTLQNLCDETSYSKTTNYEFKNSWECKRVQLKIKGNLNDVYNFKISLTKISDTNIPVEKEGLNFVQTSLGIGGGYSNSVLTFKQWKAVSVGETIEISGQRILNINDINRLTFNISVGTDFDNKEGYTSGQFKINNCIVYKDLVPKTFHEGIKSFGEAEGNKISILSRNKNLLDLDLFINNINNLVSGGVAKIRNGFTVTAGKAINGMYYKLKKPIDECILSYDVVTKDSSAPNKGWLFLLYYEDGTYNTNYIYQGHVTIKSKTGSGKIVGVGLSYSSVHNEATFTNVQLEEGTTATHYEPYEEDKKDILLPWEGGLRGFVNVADELNSISRKVVKRIDKVALNGEEVGKGLGWELWSVLEDTIKFKLNDDRFINSRYKEVLSNKLPWASGNMTILDKKTGNFIASCYPGANGLGLVVGIRISELPTPNLEGFKSLLKQWHNEDNPLIVYYELATPVEYPLDTDINLNTYDSVTHINFENVIEGTSSFKAPINATQMLARLDAENRVLKEENLKLKEDLESITLTLENSDLELIKQNVDLDFRVMEIEFALDVPINLSNQNIKFINKKGEIKSMARTPYEMMKIVVLSGDYDREDYMKKAKTYYDRGRMTKEEYEELVSLMTADEVINK